MDAHDAAHTRRRTLELTIMELEEHQALLQEIGAALGALGQGQRAKPGQYLALRRRALTAVATSEMFIDQLRTWAGDIDRVMGQRPQGGVTK